MRIKLTTPSGETHLLDTPDPVLIGSWLKTWFDYWAPVPRPGQVVFTLEIS